MKREIDSQIETPLMLTPWWIVHPERLMEERQYMNRIGAEVVLTVATKEEADRLLRSGLNFGNVRKPVTQYWEANPRTLCFKCCGVGHEKPGACGDRPQMCAVCGRGHITDDHTCSVTAYRALRGRRCLHDSVKCGNCISMGWDNNKHTASSLSCRWKKEVISKLAARRFEKGKERAMSKFEGIVIQRRSPQQAGPGEEVENEREVDSPVANIDGDLDMEEGEIIEGTPISSKC